jgi:PAS domain-containing protein
MASHTITSVGIYAQDSAGSERYEPAQSARIVAALRARRGGVLKAVAPLLDQQAWMLTQELRLDQTTADRVLQGQRAMLNVLATRYNALDDAIVCSEIPFAEIHNDGRVVYANGAFEKLIPEWEGMVFSSLFGARAPHVKEALWSESNTSLRVDFQVGSALRQVRLEIGPLRYEDGERGSYALLLDQTAERSRLNALDDGALRTDLAGRICFANKRAVDYLGFDRTELLERHPIRLDRRRRSLRPRDSCGTRPSRSA